MKNRWVFVFSLVVLGAALATSALAGGGLSPCQRKIMEELGCRNWGDGTPECIQARAIAAAKCR
jgi:hypothetical protein